MEVKTTTEIIDSYNKLNKKVQKAEEEYNKAKKQRDDFFNKTILKFTKKMSLEQFFELIELVTSEEKTAPETVENSNKEQTNLNSIKQ
jgi:hypothetical protein